jgi:hypothetical protein
MITCYGAKDNSPQDMEDTERMQIAELNKRTCN